MNPQPVGSGIIIWSCVDCKRPGSLSLPLMVLPDNTSICDDCQRLRQRPRDGTGTIEREEVSGERPHAPPDTLYSVVGLPLDASAEEVAGAIKGRMKYWLARQSGNEGHKAVEMLEKLRTAAQVLKDPDRRRTYDEEVHQQMRDLRAQIIETTISPLEDWPGRQVNNLKDLITACEESAANWKIGEQLLMNKSLIRWVRWGLDDNETVRLIERVIARQELSVFRKLNELLYQFDPGRPFRFFSDTNRFEAIKEKMSVGDIAALTRFADAQWNLVVQHLYRGELITWLDQSINPTGRYLGQTYHNARQFFQEVCAPFAGSRHEGVGLEALLEFLDPLLKRPEITVTFDTQPAAYTLLDWDEELPHQPVTLSIKNTTRGYFAGTVELLPPGPKHAPLFPWVDFDFLPLKTPPLQSRPWSTNQAFTLAGAQEQQISLYLGNFQGLARGRKHKRALEMRRYIKHPAQLTTVQAFPLTLSIMRFRAGYRGKLWAHGLRGGLLGMLLDGGLGFGIGALLFWLGLLFTPHGSWGFFQDFSGPFTWIVAADGALVALSRPFFLAIALFGFELPAVLGCVFAFCGFFAGWRRGHTAFSSAQDKKRHRALGLWLMFGLWAVAGGMVALFYQSRTYPAVLHLSGLGISRSIDVTAFFVSALGFAPIHSPVFDALVIAVPGIFAYIAMRIVIAIRTRLYARVEKRWGNLLKPVGRG